MSDKNFENSSGYFENRACKSYPCHKGMEHINCLFCYCPLYHMDNCPGQHKFIQKEGKRIKSCIDCGFPHEKDNYEKVMAILKNNLKG